MNALEDRLRTELRAESRLITEKTIPALSLPGQDGQRAAGRGWHAPALVRRGTAPRRWPGWLAPVAAAAAVAGVIIASLAVSGLIGRDHAGSGPANSTGVLAKVPRYFVAIPEVSTRAVVGAAIERCIEAKRPLFVTGHSLGAAIALATVDRARREKGLDRAQVFVFGAPRVGAGARRQECSAPAHHLER